MANVTILMEHENHIVTVTAVSLAQARQRIGAAWADLFEAGPRREAAVFEVIMTEVAESLGEAP